MLCRWRSDGVTRRIHGLGDRRTWHRPCCFSARKQRHRRVLHGDRQEAHRYRGPRQDSLRPVDTVRGFIAWRSIGGTPNAGTVTFAPSEKGTRLSLMLEYEPRGAAEKTGDILGVLDRRVQGDLARFKRFIEERREPTGAWRDRAGLAHPYGASPGSLGSM